MQAGFALQNALQQGLERTCYHHEAWTWDLLRVLFETLPGDGQPGVCRGATAMLCFLLAQLRAHFPLWRLACLIGWATPAPA